MYESISQKSFNMYESYIVPMYMTYMKMYMCTGNWLHPEFARRPKKVWVVAPRTEMAAGLRRQKWVWTMNACTTRRCLLRSQFINYYYLWCSWLHPEFARRPKRCGSSHREQKWPLDYDGGNEYELWMHRKSTARMHMNVRLFMCSQQRSW